MKYITLIILSSVLLYSCNTESKEIHQSIDQTLNVKNVSSNQKYFEYDSIDYYSIRIKASEINNLYENKSKSEIDSFRMGIIIGNIPNSINDLTFIDKLTLVGYKMVKIDKSKFDRIDDIFREKKYVNYTATLCKGEIYRDILIFKMKNKVRGTAKICFSCLAHRIEGTTANTSDFGQDGDYDKLAKLLNH